MSATGEVLTSRGRAILGRFPVHLDVERGGKQLSHVVEALGAPFDPMASQLARVRNARRLDYAAALRDLALLGALHGVDERDLGMVYAKAEQLAELVTAVSATIPTGGDALRSAALALLDALDVAGGDERLAALAPAGAPADPPDEQAAARALLDGVAPLIGFDAVLEATRRRLRDICDLHGSGNGTVRALLMATLSVLDVEPDADYNATVKDALRAANRTEDLDLNIRDEFFHSADHFWHSSYVRPSAPLVVSIGVTLPPAPVMMGEDEALVVLSQRTGVPVGTILARAATLGVASPAPETRVAFDVADDIGAAEGFGVQRKRRGLLTLTGAIDRASLARRLGAPDARVARALTALLSLASAPNTMLTPQQAAVVARKWGMSVALQPEPRHEAVGLEENPLKRQRIPSIDCEHGRLFTVRRRGFGRQTLRVQVDGIETLTVGPMFVNRDEGRGVVFNGEVPAGSQLMVTEEGRVFLDGADQTSRASSWEGACFADAANPGKRDFVFDGLKVPARTRARFATFVPAGSLDREGVVPHAPLSLTMPGINIGETRFAFFVQQAHLAHRGTPPELDLLSTPRMFIGFADQSTLAGSDTPGSPSPEDPPVGRVTLSWLEHEGYVVRVLIPSRFRALDGDEPGVLARVRAALERVRPAGIELRVEYADDRWTLGQGTVTDPTTVLDDNPNDLLQGGTRLWSPDEL